MKKYLLIILILGAKASAQDTIFYPKIDDFRRNYFEIGLQQPQNELSDKFDYAINAGVWFRNKLRRNLYLDFGLELGLLHKPREINYSHEDSIVKLESNKVALKAGARLSKVFALSANPSHFSVESNTGTGWAALYYTIPTYYEGTTLRDDLGRRKNLHTIFLSQTVKFNVQDFGLFCTYYYTPYHAFRKQAEAHFGSESLAFGVVYRR